MKDFYRCHYCGRRFGYEIIDDFKQRETAGKAFDDHKKECAERPLQILKRDNFRKALNIKRDDMREEYEAIMTACSDFGIDVMGILLQDRYVIVRVEELKKLTKRDRRVLGI